jgi:selenocysteine lyase/cysteine desulfurase
LRVYGLTDPHKLDQRVPTFSFRLGDKHPLEIAKALAAENIYVWDGNYYALEVTTRLGLEESGGMVRVGAAHYNTVDEVKRLGEALKKIA